MVKLDFALEVDGIRFFVDVTACWRLYGTGKNNCVMDCDHDILGRGL